jgi:hypothetical protein
MSAMVDTFRESGPVTSSIETKKTWFGWATAIITASGRCTRPELSLDGIKSIHTSLYNISYVI